MIFSVINGPFAIEMLSPSLLTVRFSFVVVLVGFSTSDCTNNNSALNLQQYKQLKIAKRVAAKRLEIFFSPLCQVKTDS